MRRRRDAEHVAPAPPRRVERAGAGVGVRFVAASSDAGHARADADRHLLVPALALGDVVRGEFADARPSREQPLPHQRRPHAERRRQTDAGDDDAPGRAHGRGMVEPEGRPAVVVVAPSSTGRRRG